MTAEHHRPRSLERALPYVLSFPALAFLSVAFFVPVLNLLFESVFVKLPDGRHVFSLIRYEKLFSDSYTLDIIGRTIEISAITTVVTLVLAFPVALYLRIASPRLRATIVFLLLSPLLTSVVVRTIAWVILLEPQGIVNQILGEFGFGKVKLIYNVTGVIIGLSHVYFGYMFLAIMTSVIKIDENLLLAANNLGAGRWQILGRIIIPLSLPGVLAGCTLVFTMSASSYATPVLLGGSRARVLATEVYDVAIEYLDWPEAATLATVLFVLTWLTIWILTRIVESGRRKVIFQ